MLTITARNTTEGDLADADGMASYEVTVYINSTMLARFTCNHKRARGWQALLMRIAVAANYDIRSRIDEAAPILQSKEKSDV